MNNSYSNQIFSLPLIQTRHYLVLFILWPFLACLTAISNYADKEARKVVYLFLIYYGLTFVIGNEGIDASRYALSMKAYAGLPFSDIFKVIGGIYATDTSIDIAEPLISFIVSRFTENHRILFAAYAALFGYFYLKSIDLLFDHWYENRGWNSIIHLIFFASILPITSINGFRMWTAAWIFFYGAYHVILHHNPKYLILTMSACLVHFSFLSANAVLIIYYFAGNRNFVYLPLSILSFVLPGLLEPLFQSAFGVIGSGALKARVDMYTDEAYVLGRQEALEQVSWFMQLGSKFVLYYLLLAIIFIQIQKRHSVKEQSEKNLFSFLLLFLSFVNFGMAIPSFGGRFLTIFFMFAALYVFLHFAKHDSPRIAPLTLIGLFPMLLYAVIAFRQGSETMNAWLFAPGFGIPWLAADLTIYDVLFQ